jgi:hypothetical protein
VVRLLPALPGYIYAVRDDQLYVNLYIGSEATANVNGVDVQLVQETQYPWDGRVKLTVNPQQSQQFTLRLRVPGWASGQPVPSDLYRYLVDSSEPVFFWINGKELTLSEDQGYISINRTWQPGDIIELEMPMPIRRVVGHEKIADVAGKVALERGPIVYTVEGIDNGGHVLDFKLSDDAPLKAETHPDLLGGVVTINGKVSGADAEEQDFVAIPYYAWSHRGVSEMAVWLHRAN